MSRLLLFLFSVAVALDGSAEAQWFGKRTLGARLSRVAPESRVSPTPIAPVPNHYRTPYPTTTTGGISIGVFSYPDHNYPRPGSFDPYRFDRYVYDPYRFGSFEAPDLLNDPYFRERHRYDSHFPGRRPAPLTMRTTAPEYSYPSPRNPLLYEGDRESLRTRAETRRPHPGRSNAAPQQLSRFLSDLPDGQAWIEFLAPDQIDAMIRGGDLAELTELLSHYDGIVNNPALESIATAPGFHGTRQLLIDHVPAPDPTAPDPLATPTFVPAIDRSIDLEMTDPELADETQELPAPLEN